jgi:hypothetical protein
VAADGPRETEVTLEYDDIMQQVGALSPADRQAVGDFIAFLRWRAEAGQQAAATGVLWRYNLLEYMDGADVRASKRMSGMEVKGAEAAVGGETRPALWEHPPVEGEAIVEFHVPVPAQVKNARLRFATGIRDGSEGTSQLVAFRVRVDGWQVWSRAGWPRRWEAAEVPLPFQAGNVLRVAFVTDGLGSHSFAWAAWGEPELVGDMAS